MKKLLVFSMAALLVAAFCVPASALENVFGGYWRTRGFINENFSGQKDDPNDISRVDTRSRIYYDAILNDNLKFVNKFEWNVTWGDETGGDIGTDGTGILRIKHSYADFNTGPVNHKIGLQGKVFSRGFVFDDDHAGYQGVYKADRWWLRGSWLKVYEGNNLRPLKDSNKKDFDLVGLEASFSIGEAGAIIPYVIYGYADEYDGFSGDPTDDSANVYWIGADADFTLGTFGLWASAGYSGGKVKGVGAADDEKRKGWLVAAGGNVPLGPASIHGQGFYASGDDDLLDDDQEAFQGAPGQSYYWSEIMGLGTFDSQASAGAPGNLITNIWALNIGATIKPFDKLSIRGDVWYASLVEDNQTGEKDLGIEADLVLTYQLVEGLNLDLIGAYLFAGDATSNTIEKNDKNPWEIGWRTSLSF